MSEDFSLYEFTKSLSIAGWIALTLVLMVIVYLFAKGIEILVTKRCPFCEKRVPRRSTECNFCKRGVG